MLHRIHSQLIAIIALIFLFGLAQQASVAHEISHLADYTKPSQNNHSSKNQQDKSAHSNVCEKCLSFSQLCGAIASSHFVEPIFANDFTKFSDVKPSVQSRFTLYYGARAPPQLT